jgi:hypothetical protein
MNKFVKENPGALVLVWKFKEVIPDPNHANFPVAVRKNDPANCTQVRLCPRYWIIQRDAVGGLPILDVNRSLKRKLR